MERYMTVIASSGSSDGRNTLPRKKNARYSPYGSNLSTNPPKKDPTDGELIKDIVSSLGKEGNLITGSKKGDNADHVSSTATGHERSERRGHRSNYIVERNQKLAFQRNEEDVATEKELGSTQVFRNLRFYVGGFMEDTTDIEMKRILTLAGGTVLHTASGATHILTSQQLSGSKTQKTLKSKSKVHVVSPDWVFDSLAAGKRCSEIHYNRLNDTTAGSLTAMFARKTPASKP